MFFTEKIDRPRSLDERISDGKYGFGPWSVLVEARGEHETNRHGPAAKDHMVVYASRLYSVMNGCFTRNPLYWPQGLCAGKRLRRLLWAQVQHYFGALNLRQKWTADQCETIAAILWSMSRSPIVQDKHRPLFAEQAHAFVEEGLRVSTKETSPHTMAFLYLRSAEINHESELALWSELASQEKIEDMRRSVVGNLDAAIDYASRAANPDQRSRCCRGIAELYHRLGNPKEADRFMETAEWVQGISASTREKNAAARKRMGLLCP